MSKTIITKTKKGLLTLEQLECIAIVRNEAMAICDMLNNILYARNGEISDKEEEILNYGVMQGEWIIKTANIAEKEHKKVFSKAKGKAYIAGYMNKVQYKDCILNIRFETGNPFDGLWATTFSASEQKTIRFARCLFQDIAERADRIEAIHDRLDMLTSDIIKVHRYMADGHYDNILTEDDKAVFMQIYSSYIRQSITKCDSVVLRLMLIK